MSTSRARSPSWGTTSSDRRMPRLVSREQQLGIPPNGDKGESTMTHRAQEQTVSERQQRTGETRASGQGSMIVRTIRRNPQRTTTSIAVIKGVHSLVFLSMAASILYTLYSGLTNRISRLTVVSIAAVIGEGLVLLMNGMRCPLT